MSIRSKLNGVSLVTIDVTNDSHDNTICISIIDKKLNKAVAIHLDKAMSNRLIKSIKNGFTENNDAIRIRDNSTF